MLDKVSVSSPDLPPDLPPPLLAATRFQATQTIISPCPLGASHSCRAACRRGLSSCVVRDDGPRSWYRQQPVQTSRREARPRMTRPDLGRQGSCGDRKISQRTKHITHHMSRGPRSTMTSTHPLTTHTPHAPTNNTENGFPEGPAAASVTIGFVSKREKNFQFLVRIVSFSVLFGISYLSKLRSRSVDFPPNKLQKPNRILHSNY